MLNDFKRDYQQEGNLYIVLKIPQKLVDWLIRHVSESDKRLGLFLKGNTSQTKGETDENSMFKLANPSCGT